MCLQQPRTDAFVHHLGAAVGVGGDLGAGEMAVKAVFLAVKSTKSISTVSLFLVALLITAWLQKVIINMD